MIRNGEYDVKRPRLNAWEKASNERMGGLYRVGVGGHDRSKSEKNN